MDRTSPPPFQQSLAFSLPQPEKFLPEGWYISSSQSDVVQVEIIFEAGRVYEPTPGIAQFTTHMLDKGVPGRNAAQIANELDYFGAHLEVKAGFDFVTVTLSSLSKNLKKLLPLFLSIINTPVFPDDELSLYQKIFTENLKINLEKNDFVASNLIRKKVYGAHPYGSSVQLGDIPSIHIDAVKHYYKQCFQPSKIFIVGNIEQDDLALLASEIKTKTSSGIKSQIDFSSAPPVKAIEIGPGKTQAAIKLGQRTINRTHSDYPALQIINHLLGGFFGSRLMKNIREEKGLTYGIYSALQNYRQASNQIISAEVNTDQSEFALEEILKEVEAISTVSEEELTIAKNHLIGSLQNDITTVFAASEKIKNIILNELPSDFYNNLIQSINQVNPQHIEMIARKYLNPKDLSVVVVK
jgi:zinc protease